METTLVSQKPSINEMLEVRHEKSIIIGYYLCADSIFILMSIAIYNN